MRFSICATYYQGCDSDAVLQSFLDSLKNQYFKDFEVIIYHDGKLDHKPMVDNGELNIRYYNTPTRGNKFGHDMRTELINLAEGEYILHTNVDNYYYDSALESIDGAIKLNNEIDIAIFQVKMMGMNSDEHLNVWYDKPRDYTKSLILKGTPRLNLIDMMQLVCKSSIWKKHGWFVLHEQSDGVIYEFLCNKYDYKIVPILIGEHY